MKPSIGICLSSAFGLVMSIYYVFWWKKQAILLFMRINKVTCPDLGKNSLVIVSYQSITRSTVQQYCEMDNASQVENNHCKSSAFARNEWLCARVGRSPFVQISIDRLMLVTLSDLIF
ncbi:unnamed protein product [Mucor circinelloides]